MREQLLILESTRLISSFVYDSSNVALFAYLRQLGNLEYNPKQQNPQSGVAGSELNRNAISGVNTSCIVYNYAQH